MPTSRSAFRLTAVLIATGLAASLAGVAAGPADAAHAHSPARAGGFQVTIKASETEPVLGDRVILRGAVTPAAPGQGVRLEVLYANRTHWKTIDSDTLNGLSKYKVSDKVGSVRVRKYRVVTARGAGGSAGRSPSVKVTVYGWRPLTSLPAVNNTGFSEVGSASINGVSYSQSLWGAAATATTDFNLNHNCNLLDATYGLDDTSPSGASTTLGVAVDGVAKYAGSFGLTQSQKVLTDVTGAFRVTFTETTTGSGRAVVGSPMVLCNF